MNDFMTAHPYLTFAAYVVTLLFILISTGMHLSSKKERTEPKPQPKLPEDTDVYLGELDLDEAVLHCQEIADKNQGTLCGKNHTVLALWLTELKTLRQSSGVKEDDRG